MLAPSSCENQKVNLATKEITVFCTTSLFLLTFWSQILILYACDDEYEISSAKQKHIVVKNENINFNYNYQLRAKGIVITDKS